MTPRSGDVIPVIVEAAMGADLTASAGTWSWTNLSSRLMGQATIVRGRADEASQTQPATLTIRLRNNDGWLTPRHPSSPWYQLWQRGTPIRLKITVDGVTYTRCQGRVTVIQPIWPSGNSEIAYVDVTVKGALYTLQQGKPPAQSPLFKAITAQSALRAYWPMEDGAGATSLASGVPGGPAMVARGLNLGADSSEPGSFPLPTFTGTGSIHGQVSGSFSSHWQVDWYYKIADPTPAEAKILTIYTMDQSGAPPAMNYDLYVGGGAGVVTLRAINYSGATVINQNGIFGAGYFGVWVHARIMVQQSGGNISWQLVLFPLTGPGLFISNTLAGTVSGPYGVGVQSGSVLSGMAMGHLAVFDAWDLGAADQAQSGFADELVTTRISRLSTDQNTPVVITGTSATRLGPQSIATLDTLLRQAEDVDMGILTDGLGPGLGYLTRDSRYNQPVALALDAARGHVKWPPFEPVEDDQRLRNKVTVSRIGGSSATYTDPSSKTEGDYPDQVSLNLSDDTTLSVQASWRAHLFTVEEMRAPAIAIDLRDTPELIAPWLATDIGDRYTIANPPVQYPPGGLDLVLEQYVEVIDGITWRATLTGSPFAPWRVFQLAAETGDTSPYAGRLDTEGSVLASSRSAVAPGTVESWSVTTTTGPLWTTRPDDLLPGQPIYLACEGEQVAVTAISGASSPQTMTVIRGVNGVSKAHAAGAAVSLWQPLVLAL